MTWRPSELRSALGERQPTAVMVAAGSIDPDSVTVTAGVNDVAVFRFTPDDGVTYTDWTVKVPPTPASPLSAGMAGETRDYRDGVMAALAISAADLPFEFTAIGGKTAVVFYGARRGTLSYQSGTATYLGFNVGQSVPVAAPGDGSLIASLMERVAALEVGGGGGGAGSVALGGVNCWYASPTAPIAGATLGYASGSGVAAVSPLFIDQELSFSKMQMEIHTNFVSTQTYTCVLYDTADGYPNLLLAKADIATGTSGGSKEAAITPITLAPGTYWIGAWVGNVEPATGLLVNNVGVGIMMAHSPSGSGKTGNQRIAAGWKSTNIAAPAAGSTWPGRNASGMGTDYRVPRVALWAG